MVSQIGLKALNLRLLLLAAELDHRDSKPLGTWKRVLEPKRLAGVTDPDKISRALKAAIGRANKAKKGGGVQYA